MFVYIRSAAFIIVVTQKLVLQQSKNVTAKCIAPSLYSILLAFEIWKYKKSSTRTDLASRLYTGYSRLVGTSECAGPVNPCTGSDHARLGLCAYSTG